MESCQKLTREDSHDRGPLRWFGGDDRERPAEDAAAEAFDRPCTCTLRIITTGLPGRPSQEQKGLAERVLMASQRLSHPW
jgi:hypothetical protein